MHFSNSNVKSKVVALAASVALSAGSVVAVASTAAAAPGDTQTFTLPFESTGVTSIGSTGWAVGSDGTNSSISRISPEGAVASVTVPGFAQSIAAGPDGNVWVPIRTRNEILRIDPNLNVTTFSDGLPANLGMVSITAGPDGAMWFSAFQSSQIGKITTAGAVTMYSTDGLQPRTIAAGPSGSNVLYFGATGSELGRITTAGTVSKVQSANGVTITNFPVAAGDGTWFVLVAGIDALARVAGSNSLLNAAANQNSDDFTGSTTAVNGGFWVSAGSNNKVIRYDKDGTFIEEYAVAGPSSLHQSAADGSLWINAGGNTVVKMNVAVVPVSTEAPSITPTEGIVPGSTLTVSNGTWNFADGATYAYFWQQCANSDPATCGPLAGAVLQTYTVAATDIGKYVRGCVLPTTPSGPAAAAACSAPVAMGSTAPPPNPTPNPPTPATGETASIGNGVIMELDAPSKQKRGKKAWYEVAFTATDVQGSVVFEFSKGSRTKTKTVAIQDGIAEYRWKTPRKWRKGRTTVTATFVPSAGSPYTAAEVLDRVRIR
jgi:virginiamycin B lyase